VVGLNNGHRQEYAKENPQKKRNLNEQVASLNRSKKSDKEKNVNYFRFLFYSLCFGQQISVIVICK
jgi:hypothetical protein